MHIFLQVIFLFGTVSGAFIPEPCPSEGCKNLTLYLGPRWGVVVIPLPNHQHLQDLTDQEAKRISELINTINGLSLNVNVTKEPKSNDFTTTSLPWERNTGSWRRYNPVVRNDNSGGIFRDFVTTRSPWDRSTRYWSSYNPVNRDDGSRGMVREFFTTRTPLENKPRYLYSQNHEDSDEDSRIFQGRQSLTNGRSTTYPPNSRTTPLNVNNLFAMGTLFLAGRNMTGEDLKVALSELTESRKQNLRRLVLSNNNIRSLPPLVWPLELEYGLEELILDNNPLGVFSKSSHFELSRLGNLKVLNLSRTRLLRLDSAFSGFSASSLETLDLSHNYLNYIPDTLFLPHLEVLDLSHNRISELFKSLTTLNNLRMLNLSNNYINYIDHDAATSIPYLQQVDLRNNSLRSASQVQFIGSYGMLLSGNPWECSCPLLELIHRLPWTHDGKAITCTDDNHLTATLVSSLTERDVHIQCPGSKEWLLARGQQVEYIAMQVERSPILLGVGLALMILVVVAVLRRGRNKVKPTKDESIYNILEKKQYSKV